MSLRRTAAAAGDTKNAIAGFRKKRKYVVTDAATAPREAKPQRGSETMKVHPMNAKKLIGVLERAGFDAHPTFGEQYAYENVTVRTAGPESVEAAKQLARRYGATVRVERPEDSEIVFRVYPTYVR
jgi:hypothetical protein